MKDLIISLISDSVFFILKQMQDAYIVSQTCNRFICLYE